jgi:hypothetical protein
MLVKIADKSSIEKPAEKNALAFPLISGAGNNKAFGT